MKRRNRPLAAALLGALLLACSWLALIGAQTGTELRSLVGRMVVGQVTSVVDGDTLHLVLDDGRAITVRLDGIDAPESGEPFSAQARNAARVMLFDKRVQVNGTDVDRYGRLVARVSAAGIDSSLALVQAGLACHFIQYSKDAALAAAQAEARTRARGFWAAGAQKPACVVNTQAPAIAPVTGPFRGNTESRVYHAPSCRNYRCRNCTAEFQTAEDAVRAGFRPAGDCLR